MSFAKAKDEHRCMTVVVPFKLTRQSSCYELLQRFFSKHLIWRLTERYDMQEVHYLCFNPELPPVSPGTEPPKFDLVYDLVRGRTPCMYVSDDHLFMVGGS